MTPEFLRAVVDTLLPGEAAAPNNEPKLPAGSAAGVDLAEYIEASQQLLETIAKAAGDAQGFVEADETSRVEVLQSVQRDEPAAFAGLLGLLLPDYYENPAVLNALGWRSQPPQPQGHIVSAMDDATRKMLERVRLGRKLWCDWP
jgi:hypothetical protein